MKERDHAADRRAGRRHYVGLRAHQHHRRILGHARDVHPAGQGVGHEIRRLEGFVRPVCPKPVIDVNTKRGCFSFRAWYPIPQPSMVPGSKVSMTRSAVCASRRKRAWPSAVVTSRVTARLLNWCTGRRGHARDGACRPRTGDVAGRIAAGALDLMTSAPISASSFPQ